jgi:hypothetical protein
MKISENVEERVATEKQELDSKIARLYDFISGRLLFGVSDRHKILLKRQHEIMVQYSNILGERLRDFKDSPPLMQVPDTTTWKNIACDLCNALVELEVEFSKEIPEYQRLESTQKAIDNFYASVNV